MKVRDIMTPRPLSIGPAAGPGEIRRLIDGACIHHLLVVDHGELTGIWLSTDERQLVLIGPERAVQTTPDSDAVEAMAQLLDGREAVVVWGAGSTPEGVITRSDVMAVIRAGLGQGLGRRSIRPLVLRLIGRAGSGKSTLLVRTLERLRHCEAAVVQANADHVELASIDRLAGSPLLCAPDAHSARGLARAVKAMGDTQLIIVEDRDGPPVAGTGLGEDVQALVVPAGEVGEIDLDGLCDVQVLLVTRLDVAHEGVDLTALRELIRRRAPHVAVFAFAALHDDRGLTAWCEWLEARVLRSQH
jgi:Ni2+-binding GTPase involved in maturation of urease and hydrogenase